MLDSFFQWLEDKIANATFNGLKRGVERAKGPPAIAGPPTPSPPGDEADEPDPPVATGSRSRKKLAETNGAH